MPRSGWLATGAVAAALGGELLGIRVVAASVAMAAAMLLMLGSTAAPATRRRVVPATVAMLCAATALAARLSFLPAGPPAIDTLPEGNGPWHATVVATGSPREGRQAATIELVEPGGAPIRLAATLPRYPVVAPGQRIVLDGSPERPPESPYGAYLKRTGVAGTILARSLEVEPGPPEASAALETVRRGAASALARVLPEPEAGLAAGILIGLRERVDRELASDFTTAGVSHVVAISGWNIAIVAAAVGALGGSLGRRRRSVLTMLAIVAYVAFSGASPSVVRAAAMAGVVLLARESGRAGRAAAALGWAVTLLLLADPALISDAGFQLSSLATAGLIAWATPIGERIGRIGGSRVPGWLAESLGVSLAAQAATLPVVLATFGRLALIAPAANLAIVPVVPVAMAAGGIAFGAGLLAGTGAPDVLTAALAFPGWLALTIMVAIARFAADVPFASATLEPPSNLVAAAAATAALVGLEWRRRHPRTSRPRAAEPVPTARNRTPKRPRFARATRLAVLALASSVVLTAAVVIERPSGRPTVTVLDVGQGDAILVEGSNGGRLLVDGGPDPDRLLVELDRRIPPWDRRLDAVVLSHPHEDHVAGLALLLERYRVGRTFEPGMLGPGPGYAAWAAELADRPTPGSLLAAGDRLAIDDVALEVLWPVRGTVPRKPSDTGTGINNVSIVLLGSVAGRRFLLTGDVEEEVDPDLLVRVGHVDLLKVAHHGSRTASTDAFLDAVVPTVAVASAGAGNPYGHPSPATLARVEARGARVFRTDRDGSVTVTFDPTGITVRSSGGRPRPTPRPRPSASTGVPATAYFCAVPQRLAAAPGGAQDAVRPAPATAIRLADPTLYHRLDDGARQDRSRPADALARTAGLAPQALTRRRRGCRVPRSPDRRSRRRDRPPAGGNRGVPPRRRQGTLAGRSPPRPRPRPWIGALARASRLSGPGRGSRGPPCHASARRRLVRVVAQWVARRGPNRRLRGQAGPAATRVARRPLRRMAPPPPGQVGHRCRGRGAEAGEPARVDRVRGGRYPPR
jgi:competence protein ComEC